MESKGQSTQEKLKIDEEEWIEENSGALSLDEELAGEGKRKEASSETRQEQPTAKEKTKTSNMKSKAARKSFANGLSIGVGIGSIATFVIMWVAIFFTPQLPEEATYESMLSMFMFPLIYLLAVGLITLTTGIVREYYPATPET